MPRANLNKGLLALNRSSVLQLICRKAFATFVSYWRCFVLLVLVWQCAHENLSL
jgi:hypothetical protein